MYVKYYGIFKWINNNLYGYCTDYNWHYGFVYRTTNLKFLTDYLQGYKKDADLKDAFILKISGRYFTPIYKKYGVLYKIEWDKINYYYTHSYFHKYCISYKRVNYD